MSVFFLLLTVQYLVLTMNRSFLVLFSTVRSPLGCHLSVIVCPTELSAARIKKTVISSKKPGQKDVTKFKIRCSRYLYTLVVDDAEKAEKLASSLPPGKCPIPLTHHLTSPCLAFPMSFRCFLHL